MRKVRLGIWVSIYLALCGSIFAASSAALAQGSAFGALDGYLPQTGASDAWQYTTAPGSFEIKNIGDPQAIQYFYVAPAKGAEGRRRIETTLTINSNSTGSAGLLYGLNQQRTLYHMVTLDAKGTVRLFRRDGSGFRAMMETTSSAFLPGKPNQLAIQEKGDEISYFLNGTSLGSLGGNLFGAGAAGLGAVGDVWARYTRFTDDADGDRAQLAPPSTTGKTQKTTAQAPTDTIEVKRIQIYDQQGPAGPMLAYETLIPKTWDTKGGIMWSQADGPNGCFTGAKLVWGAGTKDETYGVAFMDPMSWGVSNSGPVRFMCLQQDLTDAEAVMRAYFQAVSSVMQVQILDVQRPQEIQPVTQMIGQNWQRSWQGGGMMAKTWADGVLIKARVKSSSGENDAYVMAFTTHVESRYGQTMFRNGRTAMVVSLFTPVGKLEEGHPGFAPILNNLRVNPQWRKVEAQWWSQKLRTPRPGRAGSSAGASAASTSIGDMMFDSWKKREGIKDAGHAKSVNSIWEVQPWQTSSGSTVLLNQNYNHAWELDNGSIVLTNNANFSPMQAFNQTGQMMQQGN